MASNDKNMTEEHEPALKPVRCRRVSEAFNNDTFRAMGSTGGGWRRKLNLGLAGLHDRRALTSKLRRSVIVG